MKYGKERQKYYHDRRCAKELHPLRPGDYVRVKPEPESKEWKATTVQQQYALPRSYVLDAGARRIRRNRVALRTDSSKSHAGYANIVQQAEPEPDNIQVVPPLPADTHKEHPLQNCHPDLPAVPESPNPGVHVPPSSDLAEAKDRAPYKTRSGRQVRKPVRLGL